MQKLLCSRKFIVIDYDYFLYESVLKFKKIKQNVNANKIIQIKQKIIIKCYSQMSNKFRSMVISYNRVCFFSLIYSNQMIIDLLCRTYKREQKIKNSVMKFTLRRTNVL